MTHHFNRRSALKACLGIGLGALSLPRAALAQGGGFPNRPIRLLVGLPRGDVADNSLRPLSVLMHQSLGQPVVIENKPGGSFALVMSTMAQAAADGYTMVHVTNMMLSAQAVLKRYDMLKALTPVGTLGATDMCLTVMGKSQFKSAGELIAFDRANPGKLTYATPGVGTLEHLTLAEFCRRNGIDAVSVPYKGGPDVVQAVGAGMCDFCVAPVPFLVQFESKGTLRGLAMLNETRNAAVPSIPTYKEAGIDTPRLVLWGGLAVPAGTPPAVVATLEKAVLAAQANADVRKTYAAMGLDPASSGGAAYTAKLWADDWAWIS